MALRATVWAMIPGAQPEGEDAFERLDIADGQGEAAGVRLPHVFHAIAAINKGDQDLVKHVIREHARSLEQTPAPPTGGRIFFSWPLRQRGVSTFQQGQEARVREEEEG